MWYYLTLPDLTLPYLPTYLTLPYLTLPMRSIESTQYLAACAVSGAWMGTNISKLYKELDWEHLFERRWTRRLFQLYNNFNDLAPTYLKDLVPPAPPMLYGQRRQNVLFMHS